MIELKPFDIFGTYKVEDFSLWPPNVPIEYLLNEGILKFGNKLYPGGIVDINHIRIFVGYFDGIPIAFEWTYPVARFVIVEDWMLDPTYCRLYRYTSKIDVSDWFISEKLRYYLKDYEGTKYNWLQPLGIILNQRWLQLPGMREVCSTGARKALEDVFIRHHHSEPLFPEIPVWRTPPCAWANHPEIFELINHPKKNLVSLKPEPDRLESYGEI